MNDKGGNRAGWIYAAGAAILGIVWCGCFWAARADEVVLTTGQRYTGIVEQYTSHSVVIYDGNLRRVISHADVKDIIRDRTDTSWVLIGDRMVTQGDWDAAGRAYRQALEITDQPEVVLRRLERLRAYRFALPDSDKAETFLQSGHYADAAKVLTALVALSKDPGQRQHWAGRLAEAYVGLAEATTASASLLHVNPYLAYALAIAPDCAAAHAALGERLEQLGFATAARQEYLLALDLDPLERRARKRLAARGERWVYDPKAANRSGLRDYLERRTVLAPEASAPLTTAALAAALEKRVARLSSQPARLLVSAYLLDATAALAYEGLLPYPDLRDVTAAVLEETRRTAETTEYDALFVRPAVAYRLDPRFVRAIARVRSGLKPDFVTKEGARGIVPLTERQWDAARSLPARGATELSAQAAAPAASPLPAAAAFPQGSNDPAVCIEMAYRYLDWLRREVLKPYVGDRLDRLERVQDSL